MSLPDRTESLDFAERWFRDGLRAIDPPGALVAVEADMSNAAVFRTRMKRSGTPVTYNTMIVQAAARALNEHPDLHRILAGNRRVFPGTIDICVSIAGDAAVTPVVIVKDAASKSLLELGDEIRNGTPHARQENEKMLAVLRRWGWLVPLAILRRSITRLLLARPWYRRLASGTFQVSVVPTVDFFVPFLFNTAGALGAGRVRDRVVAIEGRVEIRPILILTCCIDHKIWNGMDAAKFLNAVKSCLEQPGA
jgi:pyruvate dehydrogenase E2 component (dihydrolipoamide acetyltransferase)